MATIRNPIEWGVEQFKSAAQHADSMSRSASREDRPAQVFAPEVRTIRVADLRDALTKGVEDFAAYRSDIILLCLLYPIVGFVLARVAFGYDLLPLLFPLASGFALVGPAAAIGLYEISRRREQGLKTTWADAFATLRAPAFGAIALLALLLFAIFFVWLASAQWIYGATLGPEPPASLSGFLRDVLTTGAGWTLILAGVGAGAVFAVVVLTISVVSFPLLLDRNVSLLTAISTSIRAVRRNPGPMAVWGLIVAGGLVIGSVPLLLGLIFVMPILGHATWHLYRKVVRH
ncbi:DUF2189 domain-containing protein [Algihabitans albus]|uniref:DUF2189 domain-containing protein n=1 Tax=Algihabitans albus TaxID=2164067 RepID=UPI000E5CD8B9|nr:DUF2189 domain-containing protein [Algihabitans albus]